MSRAIVCDRCLNICPNDQYFELTGWWGKGQMLPGTKKHPNRWDLKLSSTNRISGDVCADCMNEHLSFIPLYPDEPRSVQIEKLKEQEPESTGPKLLRRCLGSSVGGVGCDLCQRETIDRFLRIKSAWLGDDRANLMADICPECVTNRIVPIVQFQSAVVAADSIALTTNFNL